MIDKQKIEGVRNSCKIAAEIMGRISNFISEGMTTKDLDIFAAKSMAEFKVRSAFLGHNGFPGSICVSVNEEILHGIPAISKVINRGDVVKVDMGVVLNGFYSDTAYTFLIEDSSQKSIEARHLMDANLSALMAGIDAARPDKTVGAVALAIQNALKSRGYEPVDNMCGHGVGTRLHETPSVPNRLDGWDCSAMLRQGMTIAIEPMVGIGTRTIMVKSDGWTLVTNNGRDSSHFEHTILITENEPEILTKL